MKSINVNLTLAENAKKVCGIAEQYPYDINFRSGHYVVNAKSILGIFSLDLSKPVIMEIHSDDCNDFLTDIAPYVVK